MTGKFKEHKIRKVNTKVSENDYRLLVFVCRTYGFRSIYQLLQTLLKCFLRHVDTIRDEQEDEPMRAEISEMFEDMMEVHVHEKSRTTYRNFRNYEK